MHVREITHAMACDAAIRPVCNNEPDSYAEILRPIEDAAANRDGSLMMQTMSLYTVTLSRPWTAALFCKFAVLCI